MSDSRWVKMKEKQARLHSQKTGKRQDKKPSSWQGPLNKHGLPKLPPGQKQVTSWPVLDLGIHPQINLAEWRLSVSGFVKRCIELSWSEFLALPQVEDISDMHCVTTWSRFDNHWQGVSLSYLLRDYCGLKKEAAFVLFAAYDGYTTNIPIHEALKEDVLLVHHWEGQPLTREHGGPCRVITPQLYAWKGAKWIKHIEVSAEDKPGFWETRGYSNTADPWREDRYSGDEAPPETFPTPEF